ncbi:putative membrane protein [Halobacteriovorax marinus SJ]|uniref:Membrane protein n=1 Tax=Halobacteriovorax marinus (strain ATCC BAA-682 / DSM 15412 / SJ) TaxID=862908 RepID=E1X541_HALMS|nr:hypothetical protein [Halobacteriovorax marinus]CBW25512.1 putative membrane protein [Halobacteriovorax marinus SJ]
MIISEVFLGLVPITFFITALLLILSDLFYRRYGKLIKGRVIAIEKYISRSGSRNQTRQLMYRDLIEFSQGSDTYKFVTHGSSYMSGKLNQNVDIFILNNDPNFIRTKRVSHLLIGLAFLLASGLSFYFAVWKSFQLINFYYSILLSILLPTLFYFFLKKKSKGQFQLSDLFKTKFLSDEEIGKRDLLQSIKQLEGENSKNAKVGLLVTLVFFIFYFCIFSFSYKQLSGEEVLLLKGAIYNFENFELLLKSPNQGPVIGVLFCLFSAPLFLHSFLYSLKKL